MRVRSGSLAVIGMGRIIEVARRYNLREGNTVRVVGYTKSQAKYNGMKGTILQFLDELTLSLEVTDPPPGINSLAYSAGSVVKIRKSLVVLDPNWSTRNQNKVLVVEWDQTKELRRYSADSTKEQAGLDGTH